MAASTKLSSTTILLVTVVGCACAVAVGASTPAAAAQSCAEQIKYFTNCLARDEIRQQCCVVVEDASCLCQLKRAAVAVPCIPHRRHGHRCPRNVVPPAVRMPELQRLPCFKGLKCLRAY